MSYAQVHLPEFDQEVATTRKVLERLPEDKWDWKPTAKSNTIGWNANHLAENAGWVHSMLHEPHFDFNPVGGEPYKMPTLRTRKEILDLFDRNVAEARKALESVRDDQIDQPWSLLDGGKTVLTMSRRASMRTWFFSHMIHHRAILTAYFRMNDVAVPAIYGPSADEK